MPNHIQNRLRIIGSDKEVQRVFNHIKGKSPDGEEMQIDFRKIKPMPDGMEVEPHSGIETWVNICMGQCDFKSMLQHAQSSKSFGQVWIEDENKDGFNKMLNYMETSTAFEYLLGEHGRKNVKDFTDEEFGIFIQCLKNFRNHGYVSWYKWSIEHWGTKWNAYSQNDTRNTNDTIYFQTAWNSPVELIKTLSSQLPSVRFLLVYADEDSGSNTGKLEMQNGKVLSSTKPESQSKEGYDIYFELHPNSINNYKLVEDKYEYIEEE